MGSVWTSALVRLAVGLTIATALCPARGQEPPPPAAPTPAAVTPALPAALSLATAFGLALQANRDIRVANLDALAARDRIRAARGAFDPEVFASAVRGRSRTPAVTVPIGATETVQTDLEAGVRQRLVTGTDLELVVSGDYTRYVTDTADTNPQVGTQAVVRLTQDLLRDFGPGVNGAPVTIARTNALVSEQALRDQVMQTLYDVERTYWDLSYALADLKVREQQLERARRLVANAETRVTVGEAAPIEVTRAKSSAASQAVAILNARNQIVSVRHRLLRLLGLFDESQSQAEFALLDSPPEATHHTSVAEAMAVARTCRPDLAQADLTHLNARLQEDVAANQILPRLQAYGEYGRQGLDEDWSASARSARDDDFETWEVGLLFSLPLPNRTARAQHSVARLNRQRAAVRIEATVERIAVEVADAVDDLQTTEGRIVSAREARELAATLLAAEEKSFTLGRSDSLDVLNAQAALAAAERDEVRARTDYASALAALFRVQGDFLERRQIVFAGPQTP